MAERPEDLNLPISVISRIIKDALPEGVNVSKDARLAIGKAASVFVLYATSCSNNFAMQSKRKTISGTDVVEAMSEMEFDRFVEPLKQCLEAYKKEQKGKKEKAEKKKKEKEQDTSKEGEELMEEDGGDTANGDAEAGEQEEEDDVVEVLDDEEDEGEAEGEEETADGGQEEEPGDE